MYKKSIVVLCGGYSTKRRSQDIELFSKILINSYKCINIDKPLVKFRSDISRIERKQKYSDIRATINVYYHNYKSGYSKLRDFLYVVAVYIGFYLLPQKIANFLFKKYFRKRINNKYVDGNCMNNDIEILYIWFGKKTDDKGKIIESDSPIVNKEICFSKEYDIKFNNDNKYPVFNIIEKNLSQEKKYFYCSFYKSKEESNPNINKHNVQLTCLVGKNGSGKTLLLEYIKEILDRKDENKRLTQNLQYIIIWKDNNDSNQKYKYDCSKSLKGNVSFKGISCKETEIYELNNNTVFYSAYFNEIENKHFDPKPDNIFDLSLSYLVRKDNEMVYHKPYSDRYNEQNDNYDLFKVGDIARRIFFYSDIKNQEFLKQKFENHNLEREFYDIAPSSTYYNLYKNKSTKYIEDLKKNNRSDLSNFIMCSKAYIDNRCLENKNSKENLLWLFTRELWIICLHYSTMDFELGLEKENKGIKNDSIIFEETDNYSQEGFIYTNLGKILNHFNQFKKEDVLEIINLCKNCLIKLKKIINDYDISEEKIRIPLKKNRKDNFNLLFSFLHDYEILIKILYNSNFAILEFFPRFSSGEAGLMTLFARLYDLFKEYNKDKESSMSYNANIYDCSHLFILIDEGEVGYHPEWCKNYVYAVLNYIQHLIDRFKPEKSELNNIHIILTTNSPIILSDILPEDVVYMARKGEKLEKCKTAFGANILDLYSEPFFINTGLIGRFAQEKINKVLKYVNGYTNEEINYQFIIDSIGDQYIRTFLQKLYSEKIRKEVR